MKVILTEDIKNYGKKNDLINVSDGYAKNFLIPQNKAILATKDNLAKINREISTKNMEKELRYNKAIELKKIIEDLNLKFKLVVHDKKVGGTVSLPKIIEKLAKDHDIHLEKHNFTQKNHNYSSIGRNVLDIKLEEGVTAKMYVEIEGVEK